MKKVVIALLFGAAPIGGTVPDTAPSPFFIELANVERIDCATARGSGVRIDGNLVLTAAHVLPSGDCSIDGLPVETVHVDGNLDIAVVRTVDSAESRFSISCDGFQKAAVYYAVGYAAGGHFIVQRLRGAGGLEKKDRRFLGEAYLRGLIFGGMSGGAIVNDAGELVGLVNAGDRAGLALSRPLSQTFLCEGD